MFCGISLKRADIPDTEGDVPGWLSYEAAMYSGQGYIADGGVERNASRGLLCTRGTPSGLQNVTRVSW